MARGLIFSALMVIALLTNAFCIPSAPRRRRDLSSNEINAEDLTPVTRDVTSFKSIVKRSEPASDTFDVDSDDDFDESMQRSPTTSGGSNLFSILKLVNTMFSGTSSSNIFLRNMIQDFITRNQVLLSGRGQNYARAVRDFLINNQAFINRRQDINDNEIEIDYSVDLNPPQSQKQEFDYSEEDSNTPDNDNTESKNSDSDNSDSDSSNNDSSDSDSSESNSSDSNSSVSSSSVSNNSNNDDSEVNDNAEEESMENNDKDSDSNSDDSDSESDSDYDSDEPPGGGDGLGGGLLGILATLSGGNGETDLGSLLGAITNIIVNLSGDGFDLNDLIASGLGLFVGLLSEGEENPGTVIANYILTSLDTITGGGSKNNGAFFGNLVSKLIKGTSAAKDPDASSEENSNEMKDSAGFFISLITSLLGDMSAGSSGSSSHIW